MLSVVHSKFQIVGFNIHSIIHTNYSNLRQVSVGVFSGFPIGDWLQSKTINLPGLHPRNNEERENTFTTHSFVLSSPVVIAV